MPGLKDTNGNDFDGTAGNAVAPKPESGFVEAGGALRDQRTPDPGRAERVNRQYATGNPEGKFHIYEPHDGTIPWQQFDDIIKGAERPVDEQMRMANALTLGPMLGKRPSYLFQHHDQIAEQATGKPTPPVAFHEKIGAAMSYRNLLMDKSEIMFESWKRYMAEGEFRFTPQEQAALERIDNDMPSQEMLEATGFWDRMFMDAAAQGVQMFRNNIAALDTTAAIALAGTAAAALISRGKIAGMPQVVNGTITTAGRAALLKTGQLIGQGHMVGVAAEGGKNELGFALTELMEMRAPNGDEIPDDVKFWAAGAYGTIATALEFAGVSSAARLVPGFRDLLQQGMSSLVLKRGLHGIIAEHAKRYGANALVQAGEEMSQAITESLIQEAAIQAYAEREGNRYDRELAKWTETIGYYADAEMEMPPKLQQAYDDWVAEVQSGARQIKSRWEQTMPKALDEARSALNASLVLGAPAAGSGVVSSQARATSQIDPTTGVANNYSDLATRYNESYSPSQAAAQAVDAETVGPGDAPNGQSYTPAYTRAEQETVARSRQQDESLLEIRKRRSVPEQSLNRLSSDFGRKVAQTARVSDRKEILARERSRIAVMNSMVSEMSGGQLTNLYEDPSFKSVMTDLEMFDERTGELIEGNRGAKPEVTITNDPFGASGVHGSNTIRANWAKLQQKYNLTEEQAQQFAQTLMSEAENSRSNVEVFNGFENRNDLRSLLAQQQKQRVNQNQQQVAPKLNIHFKFQDWQDYAADQAHIHTPEQIAQNYNQSLESFFDLYSDVQLMHQRAEQQGKEAPDVHIYMDSDRYVDPDQRITFRTLREEESSPEEAAKKQFFAEKKNPLKGARVRGKQSKNIWSMLYEDERIIDDQNILRGDRLEDIQELVEENPDWSEADPRPWRVKEPVTPEMLEENKQQIMARRAYREMQRSAHARERRRVGYTQQEAEVQLSTGFTELVDNLWRQNDYTRYESGEFASMTSEKIWQMMERRWGEPLKRSSEESRQEHKRWNIALSLYVDSDMGENLPSQVVQYANAIFSEYGVKRRIANLAEQDERAIAEDRGPLNVEGRLIDILAESDSPKADIIRRALAMPEEMQQIAQEMRRRYDEVMERAIDNRVITEVAANFTARFWDDDQQHSYMGEPTELRSYTRHNLQRPLTSIMEGWSQGFDLAIEEATISYEVYMQEVEKQIALRNFLEDGQKVRDLSGTELFTEAANVPGYRRIEVPEMQKKLYLGETNDNTTLMERNAAGEETSTRVVPEKHHVVEGTSVYEYRSLYAPRRVARVLEDMFAQKQSEGWSAIKLYLEWANFRKKIKLVSNFFHPLAYIRSFTFGTNHKSAKLTRRPIKAIREFNKVLRGQESEWVDKAVFKQDDEFFQNYQISRDLNVAVRDMIRTLAGEGLSMDMKKDFWSFRKKEQETVLKEAQKHTNSKQTLELVKHMAKGMQWLTFDVMGPSMKAASAVVELTHRMRTDPGQPLQYHAKRVAQMMNDDYGGLHLKREGRTGVYQDVFRSLIMAPDWTESNIRTMVRMLDGRVDKETRKAYRKFWRRAFYKIAATNIFANFMMGMLATSQGDADDPLDFMWQSKLKVLEVMSEVGEHPEVLRKGLYLTELDLTPLWKYMESTPLNEILSSGSRDKKGFFDLENGEQVISDAIGGHFGDFLKFLFFPLDSAMGKSSMAIQDIEILMGRSDWKGYELRPPSKYEFDEWVDLVDPESYVMYSSGGGAPAASVKDGTMITAMLHIMFTALPIQMDQWVAFHAGREDAMRAILTSMGIGVSSLKDYNTSSLDLSGGNKRF